MNESRVAEVARSTRELPQILTFDVHYVLGFELTFDAVPRAYLAIFYQVVVGRGGGLRETEERRLSALRRYYKRRTYLRQRGGGEMNSSFSQGLTSSAVERNEFDGSFQCNPFPVHMGTFYILLHNNAPRAQRTPFPPYLRQKPPESALAWRLAPMKCDEDTVEDTDRTRTRTTVRIEMQALPGIAAISEIVATTYW